MLEKFYEIARPGGGDERPFGVQFHSPGRPSGLVVARFISETPLPVEMSLLAADLIHNARSALDHILARLKEHMGGDVGVGSFPTWKTPEKWDEQVVNAGRRGSLRGLSQAAVDFIRSEQPFHQANPDEDHLVVLNELDNADKHRWLSPAFVYPGANRGLDLIEIRDQSKVVSSTNLWTRGLPLEHGTLMARFLIRGNAREAVRVRSDAPIGFASGELNPTAISYLDLVGRVRSISTGAAAVIDANAPTA